MPREGSLESILTVERWGGLIDEELQNRFQGQCEMEFGNLPSDDGMSDFSVWESEFKAHLRDDFRFRYTTLCH
jgi:hypothetical protein